MVRCSPYRPFQPDDQGERDELRYSGNGQLFCQAAENQWNRPMKALPLSIIILVLAYFATMLALVYINEMGRVKEATAVACLKHNGSLSADGACIVKVN